MNGNKEVINDYNGRDYRTVWKHPRAVFEDRFETKLTKKLLTDAPGWFIDIGAGYGRVCPLYKEANRNVVLVDYAMNLMEMAVETYEKEENVYFVVANGYHLPFKKETFSGGVSIRTFHHMNLPPQFLKETARVMRAGHLFLMEYANKRNLFRIFKKGKVALQKNHEEYEPLLYGTHPEYFRETAEAAGLQVVRTLGTGFFPRFITEKTRFFSSPLSLLETAFDSTFGRFRLAPMNFAELQKNGKAKEKEDGKNKNMQGDIKDILACPACGGSLDFHVPDAVSCIACKMVFPKKGKIFDFRYTPAEK